ncbi:putative N-terminal acetyltransferase auxiliary subunit [Rosellinia necatrix]|uniref:Putative N-terminal acetyltransferase auxiliary subunit n=1 Tax=Rosellinia necatrix TaxID=77044 RepID=A0A1S7UHY4_ROSNE|nr:putative N-terminal acetyltransferase auxiliary subunit [Rosellinia necatrix]
MSDLTAPSSSFGAIGAGNALAGNHFGGQTNITFNGLQNQSQPFPPSVCHLIPFPRNDGLVRRSEIMNKLDRLLPVTLGSGYHAAALWGLGGSGKTQIALDYAHRRRSDPDCSVFWVHADSNASFIQDYYSIARKLGLPGHLSGEDLLRTVRDQIEAKSNWVLVIDNADDLGLFGVTQAQPSVSSEPQLNLDQFIPKLSTTDGCGSVLWTSRDRQIESLVGAPQTIHIEKMKPDEAEKLLDTARGKETQESEYGVMNSLLDELGHLPLAISQAAAYMRRTSTSIAGYLSLIQRGDMRQKTLGKAHYDRFRRDQESNSVLKTWDISVEYLRRQDELIYDVLHSLAYVDNQNIPFELISKAALLCHEGGEIEFDTIEIVTRLCEFSFLSIRPSSQGDRTPIYDMHKLVQEDARYRLQTRQDKIKTEAYFAKKASQVIVDLFPKSGWDPQVWGVCEQYVAHAQQAAARAELHNGQLEVAELLASACFYLQFQHRWREAEAMASTGLRFRQEKLGDQHPDTLEFVERLAISYREQNRNDEAEKMLLQILSEQGEGIDPQHRERFGLRHILGTIYAAQGRYKEAEEICQQVLPLQQEVLGKKHPYTLGSMHNLACTLVNQNRHKEAEEIYRQVLPLQQEVLGKKHPYTLGSMHNLACALADQNRYKEAEEIYRQVLPLQQKVLGKKHPYTLGSMHNLACTLADQNRYKEAEEICQQVLPLQQEVLGKKHPYTLGSMHNLACTLADQNRYKEAEEIYRQVLPLRQEVLGKKHPYTLSTMHSLAVALFNQQMLDKAEEIARDLPDLREEVLGKRHPRTLRSANLLIDILRKQGRHEEARLLSRRFSEDDVCTSQGDGQTSATPPPRDAPPAQHRRKFGKRVKLHALSRDLESRCAVQ